MSNNTAPHRSASIRIRANLRGLDPVLAEVPFDTPGRVVDLLTQHQFAS